GSAQRIRPAKSRYRNASTASLRFESQKRSRAGSGSRRTKPTARWCGQVAAGRSRSIKPPGKGGLKVCTANGDSNRQSLAPMFKSAESVARLKWEESITEENWIYKGVR